MSGLEHAFPRSQKIYIDGSREVRVPMREIALSGGNPPLRVYDTSGPQGHDTDAGLPKLRQPWVQARRSHLRSAPSGPAVTQLEYARLGEITPEMEFVSLREGL